MANNVLASRSLNVIVYSGGKRGKLASGTPASDEQSLASTLTSARVKKVYSPLSTGGFSVFDPASPTFSSLQKLERGQAYFIEAKVDFEFAETVPHPNSSLNTGLLNWFSTRS